MTSSLSNSQIARSILRLFSRFSGLGERQKPAPVTRLSLFILLPVSLFRHHVIDRL